MKWLTENWFKVAVLLVAIFFGMVYFNNQQAAEAERRIQAEIERRREYAAERKDACLNIYKTESDKRKNTTGWRYEEDEDTCYIEYKDNEPAPKEECEEMKPPDTLQPDTWIRLYRLYELCMNGRFERSF
ncbi:MAG: hypothetical protein ICV68_16280 [Pyrinomonadaceae bacterium]|nr:hypothetical protein [Pyrinomonadaceae bacterium]